jgi:hypothetical protein
MTFNDCFGRMPSLDRNMHHSSDLLDGRGGMCANLLRAIGNVLYYRLVNKG